MKAILALSAAAVLLAPTLSHAVQACLERMPVAIMTVGNDDALKCQKTMAKVGLKYVKTKAKAMGKCLEKEPAGSCPDAKSQLKIDKAVSKAKAKIEKDCELDAAQTGLTSATTYAGSTDHTIISSCMLSQHQASIDVMIGHAAGITGESFPFPSSFAKLRDKCAKTLSKEGLKYVEKAHKIASKCIDKAMKDGVGGDLSALCIGHYNSSNVFVPPTDDKAEEKQAKLVEKLEEKIEKKCDLDLDLIESVFGCGTAKSFADFQECLVCNGWDTVLDLLEQQYAESGTFVANDPNDPNELQDALDAASVDEKLLIASGTYEEVLTVGTNGLQLVGCGGADDDRPLIVPPGGPGSAPTGISSASVDGVLYQSLELADWDENGIDVAAADGVFFRDIIVDCNGLCEYGIFPVTSNNVRIETSTVFEASDAAHYVGQSTNIVVRFNRAEDSVAGIEIENSAFASVHNNYTANNTGGILVFKLPPPLPVQLSNDHEIMNNVSENNNTPNFGSGTVGLIPDGTGIFALSTDTTDIHHNFVRGNNSIGIVLIDQEGVNGLVALGGGDPPFDPTSPDQNCVDNDVRRNILKNNGKFPDTTPPNSTPFGSPLIFVLGENLGGLHGNCLFGNVINPTTPGPVIVPPTVSDCS